MSVSQTVTRSSSRTRASADNVVPHPRAATPRALHVSLLAAGLVAVVWGTLAFGAVYRWAYMPLAAMCALVGLAGLVAARRAAPPIGALAIGFAAILAAIGVQLVPLEPAMLLRLSPATDTFLSEYNFAYQVARGPHPISIAPDKTITAVALFGAFALFLFGTTKLMSKVGARLATRWLIAFGGALAVFGIVQRVATQSDVRPLIYGFWQPRFESTPFGPFVNPNHFGGWMLMTIPLALATLLDEIARTSEEAAEGRDRVGVMASSAFGRVLFLGLVTVLMGLSLFMTRSRSAIAAFTVGCLLTAWMQLRRHTTRAARVATVVTSAAVLLGVIGWAGYDTVMGKFTEGTMQRGALARRQVAWRDTLGIIARFPATGSGMNTFGTAMMVYQTTDPGRHFQESHNDYLQLMSEGGALVGLPILATIALVVRDVRRRFREAPKTGTTYSLRVGAVVGMIAIALQSLVEFSLQMPGNAALFTLLAAIALHRSPNLSLRAPAHVRQ